MKASIFYALVSALITAAAILADRASAEPAAPGQTVVSHVRTADLDLASAEGQRRLRTRLAHAARDVCGSASDVDLRGKKEVRECREAVIARASARAEALIAEANNGTPVAIAAVR